MTDLTFLRRRRLRWRHRTPDQGKGDGVPLHRFHPGRRNATEPEPRADTEGTEKTTATPLPPVRHDGAFGTVRSQWRFSSLGVGDGHLALRIGCVLRNDKSSEPRTKSPVLLKRIELPRLPLTTSHPLSSMGSGTRRNKSDLAAVCLRVRASCS